MFRLDHPARKMLSGDRLVTAIRNSRPDGGLTAARPAPKGITARVRNADTSRSTGARRWTAESAELGTMFSLVSSLTASAID